MRSDWHDTSHTACKRVPAERCRRGARVCKPTRREACTNKWYLIRTQTISLRAASQLVFSMSKIQEWGTVFIADQPGWGSHSNQPTCQCMHTVAGAIADRNTAAGRHQAANENAGRTTGQLPQATEPQFSGTIRVPPPTLAPPTPPPPRHWLKLIQAIPSLSTSPKPLSPPPSSSYPLHRSSCSPPSGTRSAA